MLSKVCKEYGLGYTVSNKGGIVFFLTDISIIYHIENMEGEEMSYALVPSKEDGASDFNFSNGTASIVLNGDTGLLGLPTVKTKTVTKQYSVAVEASEKVISQQNTSNNTSATGASGKKVKTPKTKKVLRRSVEVVCLINTAIEPQGYVTLALSEDNELTGDYRVRTVAIDGDTESGNWNMTLSLEGEW